MSECHPLPTPFLAKADDVITVLAKPILNPDPKIIKEFHELCGALLYVQVHKFQKSIGHFSFSRNT